MSRNEVFSFYEIVPELEPLTIVDVGASISANRTGYQALVDAGHATVIGFEPNPQAYAQLTAQAGKGRRTYPHFIGDGAPGTYHETNNFLTGSLFPVNVPVVSRFTNLMQMTTPVAEHPVTTHRLDDVVTDAEIDFLKMDVQGAELAVMKGAPRLLATTLLIETEVEFIPLYKGQPLFADVDTFMRGAGFQIHALPTLMRYYYTPMEDRAKPLTGLHQVVFSDAVYFPNFDRVMSLPRMRILKLVALLHDLYRSVDLALHLLQRLKERDGDAPFEAYARRLGFM